jgi:hypothetical protein
VAFEGRRHRFRYNPGQTLESALEIFQLIVDIDFPIQLFSDLGSIG